MKTIFICLLFVYSTQASTQQQAYDVFTFVPPKKWNQASKSSGLLFSTTDNVKRTWAQIDILKSTTSKGTIAADFASEWKELVMARYNVTMQPLGIDSQFFQGYHLWTGLGKFLVKNDTASILLNTFSDGQRCASFILLSNTTAYGKTLDEFIASINLVKPDKLPPKTNTQQAVTLGNTAFQFNTTNFDDGWTSVEKEEWVEATKGSTRVLLHYPRKEDEVYYTQYHERMNVFWNLLVAPRYTNLRNYHAPGSNLAEPAYFASGLVRDNASGKDVWVTLFSKGKSGWIEIITPDKASFVKAFGIENPHVYFTEWSPLLNLAGMNRFAVGENDLTGKWSNDFTNSTYYYNVYTGLNAGTSTYASRQNFVFRNSKTYNWDLAVGTSSSGSRMKVDQAKASGTWKMLNNWQIWFSEIERKPKTYNAYFSCIKGGRILWLQDVEYGSYTAYGKSSQ